MTRRCRCSQALAKELNVWLLIGSLAIKVSDTKTANRSFLFAPDGNIMARYSKIHLFDVALASGEVYRESNTVAGGDEAVVADTAFGPIGLSICYDLRFPQLYRRLAQKGAFLFTVPSAFTVPTGEAHWHVLLRARAIENGAFVIAPAQGGTHANGRKTYGHSLIVAPWGEVLAEAGTEPGVIMADIDPALVGAGPGQSSQSPARPVVRRTVNPGMRPGLANPGPWAHPLHSARGQAGLERVE